MPTSFGEGHEELSREEFAVLVGKDGELVVTITVEGDEGKETLVVEEYSVEGWQE